MVEALESLQNLKEKVVLNVDDNELNHLVMFKLLQKAGAKMVSAVNGAEAVEKLSRGLKPDVILMDLEMPLMDGLQTSQYIKEKISYQIPIIINSALVSEYHKYRLKKIGVDDFLEKPYNIKDLISKIFKYTC